MKFLKVALIEFIMLYLLFAIGTAELEPLKWDQNTREWFVMILGALWIATFCAAYAGNELKSKEEQKLNEDESERL